MSAPTAPKLVTSTRLWYTDRDPTASEITLPAIEFADRWINTNTHQLFYCLGITGQNVLTWSGSLLALVVQPT